MNRPRAKQSECPAKIRIWVKDLNLPSSHPSRTPSKDGGRREVGSSFANLTRGNKAGSRVAGKPFAEGPRKARPLHGMTDLGWEFEVQVLASKRRSFISVTFESGNCPIAHEPFSVSKHSNKISKYIRASFRFWTSGISV